MTDNVSRRRVLQGVGAGLAATAVGGQASAASTGDHIVMFEPGASPAAARRKASAVKHEFDFEHLGRGVAGTFSDAALDALSKNPNVKYIEADRKKFRAYAQTLPWGIDRVDADLAHDDGFSGSGADIAILDTGIDSDHPDLQSNIQGGKCFSADCCGEASGGGGPFGCNTNSNDCHNAWDDDNDHGTHCSGIADAVDNTEGVVGVSTEANLWAGKVLDGCGSGSLSSIAAGLEWAADQGHDVASMSLGASSGDQTLQDAVQYAYDNGVLLVAAAGNSGPCSDCVGYPAAYSEVIAVSSTASDDSLSDFSSTGPEVELAAPGTDIYSTVPSGYATFSGTSMACPHVSGAGGILMANGQSNTEARSTLQSTAEDIGLGDNEQGHGLLDAEAAANAAGDGGSTDSAPSVSWVNPSGGETVSGTVTVQIDASDSEDSDDSLSVSYTIDGGSSRSTTYNSTSGYYEDSWDTTAVSDGDHTLEASATDSAGNTTTSSITVTTDNSTDDGGDNAPVIDSWSVSSRSTGPWSRATSDWSVSDTDGDLSSVTTELLDSSGSVLDSASSSVSGSTDSGSHEVRTRSTPSDVRLTVTDAAGNSTSSTQTY